ncbi:ECF-type sigma factor [Stieleria varia]|uniref:RNA polymerase sigma factor n=1 Tax=Stieleria varia TaxID=2528005 RepID=A0A5C6AVB4_9BACT|nr:ECF-type sigma factor [Stieleria varia]TWU02986.1 RNA polymerase sigma factor [Stieleria varia]
MDDESERDPHVARPNDLPVDSAGSMSLLLRDWAANEQEIARRIHVEYFPRLRKLSHNLLQGLVSANVEADDVVQSAIMSFCIYMRGERATQNKGRDDVWRLLCRIAACKASRRRQRQTRGLRGGRLLAMSDLATDNGAGRVEDLIQDLTTEDIDLVLKDAIEHLDESLRPIALMVMEGRSQQEISEVLNVSRRTVIRKFDLTKRLLASLLDDSSADSD